LSLKKGLLAEDRAISFLEERGFEIVERNFHSRYGEIDIVAKRDEITHFIEVKSGSNFNPIQNMTEKKLRKILKTVEVFLQKFEIDSQISIDLITIRGEEIELLENISI
jgi:putative endonuclease